MAIFNLKTKNMRLFDVVFGKTEKTNEVQMQQEIIEIESAKGIKSFQF